jgi:glycerol kinase
LDVEISRPNIIETTALGAAFLAGLGVGLWTSKHQITSVWKEERRFKPKLASTDRSAILSAWDAAVRKT